MKNSNGAIEHLRGGERGKTPRVQSTPNPWGTFEAPPPLVKYVDHQQVSGVVKKSSEKKAGEQYASLTAPDPEKPGERSPRLFLKSDGQVRTLDWPVGESK